MSINCTESIIISTMNYENKKSYSTKNNKLIIRR